MNPPSNRPEAQPCRKRRLAPVAASATLLLGGIASAGHAATPDEELKSFRLADPELTIELVAAEPQVVSPVAMAWDAEGRLFVAEMNDYPIETTGGRIKLLEDKDNDGRYESAAVFADRLPFPNSVLPWNGGVLVTASPHLWFLKDTDGDNQADERRVLFTGFGEGNQQLRANGLLWGLDNWVYGANGRNDGEVRSLAAPADARSESVSIRRRDFRFRPDTGKFEAIAGQSQFGLARDDWGNRFLSWNEIPIRHELIPERYLARNPHLPATGSVVSCLPADETRRVYQISPLTPVFNKEPPGYFNALAGLTVFRGAGLGESYRGNAFMGETLRNLIHRRILIPDGPTFVARRGERERDREFLASIDPWFHPVNFATGPDGALYVADFYREFVEHPGYAPESVRSKVDWRKGAGHGRIWRIRSKQFQPAPIPKLKRSATAGLVSLLEHENGWIRDTAQRLLLERKDPAAPPALAALLKATSSPVARVHALYTLEGLGALTMEQIAAALSDVHPRVRLHGIRLAEPRIATAAGSSSSLLANLAALADDSDPAVRFQIGLTAGELPRPHGTALLLRLPAEDHRHPLHATAILSSLHKDAWPFLRQFLSSQSDLVANPPESTLQFLEEAAMLAGTQVDGSVDAGMLAVLQSAASRGPDVSLTLLAGFAEGLDRTGRSLAELTSAGTGADAGFLDRAFASAFSIATDKAEPRTRRLVALRLARFGDAEKAAGTIVRLLRDELEIGSAAVQALSRLNHPRAWAVVFHQWHTFTPAIRPRLLGAAAASSNGQAALLAALEKGTVVPLEVDAAVRQRLLAASDSSLRARAERAGLAPASRADAQAQYTPAKLSAGDPGRGAAVYSKHCYYCHFTPGHPDRLGPDLSSVSGRTKTALLADILDPSGQVAPDYLAYTVELGSDEPVTGLIAAETETSLTIRRPKERDLTLPKSEVRALRAGGKSLMPDGLEQGISAQEMADLLEFLARPDWTLVSPSP